MAAFSFIALILIVLGLIILRSLTSKRRAPLGTRKIPGPKGIVMDHPTLHSLLTDIEVFPGSVAFTTFPTRRLG